MTARRSWLILVIAVATGIVLAVTLITQVNDSRDSVTDQSAPSAESATRNVGEPPGIVPHRKCAPMPTWGRQVSERWTNLTLGDWRELRGKIGSRETIVRGRCAAGS